MDCFRVLRNPYIPLDVPNPTMAQEYQRKLTGEGIQERKAITEKGTNILFEKILCKKKLKNEEEYAYNDMIDCMADDIIRERKRIGGNWVVAGVLLSNRERDRVR